MNYLAHIYLSGTHEKTIVGNFIGDFVKGNQMEGFDDRIKVGIQLHREIDRYTDDHPVVLESKKKLWDNYHHYAAVIVDVFYDHFLACQWHKYHEVPLMKFTEDFYTMMVKYHPVLPKKAKNMLFYMQQDNWLYHYQSVVGIKATLAGMSKRTRFVSGLENAHLDLERHYDEFARDFEIFFPDLKHHSIDFLSSLSKSD